MVEQKPDELQLSEILKATSDPTRRSILTLLVQEGPTRVTDLAAYYRMSLNSVSKHIKVLEAAGLVSRRTAGRVHWISAELGPVALIDSWFSKLRSIWEIRLEKLDKLLSEDNQMTDLSLTVSRRIDAPAKKIFEAWLNPQMMAKYMIPDDSFTVPKTEIDAKVGGRFMFIVKSSDKENPHAGTYQIIDQYTKIVFTWESPFSAEGSFVIINFTPVEGGATDVELTHVKFVSEQSRDGHKRVWTTILATLDNLVS
jgi:uncharacterized protein YndB with AHSA1/START domain/DNA-binding transcriptional ArsR family regulator